MSKMISIRLDDELVKKIDTKGKKAKATRTEVIAFFLRVCVRDLDIYERVMTNDELPESLRGEPMPVEVARVSNKTQKTGVAKTSALAKAKKSSRKLARAVGISAADIAKPKKIARLTTAEVHAFDDEIDSQRAAVITELPKTPPTKRAKCPRCGGKLKEWTPTMLQCAECHSNIAKEAVQA